MAPQAGLPLEVLRRLEMLLGQKGQAPSGARTPPFFPSSSMPSPGQSSSSGPGQSPSTGQSPYSIRQDPSSTVGNLPSPVQRPAPTEMQGAGPVGVLMSLLGNWSARKQKKENAEAANAAQALMQAIEGAKTTGDWAPAESILHENEKLFNKVYKGWLQKSQVQMDQQKKSQQKPDPDVQGFEQGVTAYMQKKQQQPQGQPPQGAPPGSAPKALGGYQLPRASPEQALGQQRLSAERQATSQDPARALESQLTSGERRQTELGAGPAKVEAEVAKAQAEIQKAASSMLEWKHKAEKAALDYKVAQEKATMSGKRDEAMIKRLELENKKAQTELDIKRQQLQIQIQKKQGLKTLGQSYQLKWAAIGQVETFLNNMVANKQPIDKTTVTSLVNNLKAAGATGIAADLLKQQNTWYKSYSTPQDVLDQLKEYKGAFEKAFGQDKEKAAGGTSDENGDKPPAVSSLPGEPKVGDIEDGYKFKGGDPSDPDNWEEVDDSGK